MYQDSSAPTHFPEDADSASQKRSRSRSPRQRRGPHSAGDVVALRKTAVCHSSQTLGDACDAIIKASRTSVVVLGEDDTVKGVLTENDILAASMDGRGVDSNIASWLGCSFARLPECLVPSMTVKHDQPVIDAAQIMMREAEKDSGHSCHHVLVSRPGCDLYLLSALDIAMALIGDLGDTDEADAAHTKLASVMKPRDHMATCKLSDKLSEAFEIMLQEKQNMVLVLDADAHPGSQVHGVITAADALRSFSEIVHTDRITVASWLAALKPEEHPLAKDRCIAESNTLSDAAAKMLEYGNHHLIVLCKNQIEVAGVISALDITRALGHHGDMLF